ncbi:MAG TPA: oxygen-independent coproporphyrinogen III oxidase, partial [Bacteroidota bacterium]|nr:oxygen-independent coproporphyrinogen III oxidase [Bacteroidota bacterium]
ARKERAMPAKQSSLNIDLLKRFARPGPRYTSYPPAPAFHAEYDARRLEVDLILNNDENAKPLSLYIHIPFCDTLCYFCGCTTFITKDRSQIRRYLNALKQEIAKWAWYVKKERRVEQIHWGGGTPSYLEPDEIRELAGFVKELFHVAPDAEFSVEIDPRGLRFEHLEAFKESGVNRLSLGVQDFDERVQRAVNRIQPESLTRDAMMWSRQLGIDQINIDLIYGLPLQNVETFGKTLQKIVELAPNRIAVFNFAYVPWMKPHQKLLHPEDLPSPEMKLQLLHSTIETLGRAGYEYIGMDHFARPDDELAIAQKAKTLHRNFQGYSTKAGADLYGFGLSSISHFGNVYAQNAKTLPLYLEAAERGQFATKLGYRMSKDDEIRKFVIMRLMCDLEVDKGEVERRFGIMFDEYFDRSLDMLQEFINEGLVQQSLSTIQVVGAGRYVLRNIALCFDAYTSTREQQKPLYSQTV